MLKDSRKSTALWLAGAAVLAVAVGVGVTLQPISTIGALVAIMAAGFLGRPGRRALDRARSSLNVASSRAPMAIELAALPLAVSIRQDTLITCLLVSVLALVSLFRRRDAVQLTPINWLPILMVALATLIVFRRGPVLILVLIGLAVFVVINTALKVSRERALSSLIAGLSIYLLGNIAAWLVGIESASASTRTGGYAAESSIIGARVFFPFARSINEPAVVATVLFVAVTALWVSRQRITRLDSIGVAAGILIVAASVSRTPVLVAAALIFAIVFFPSALRRLAVVIVAIGMLVPFLLAVLQPLINAFASVAVGNAFLGRGQSVQEISGLGTRSGIWSESLWFWDEKTEGIVRNLIGYGQNGHAVSGASTYYVRDGVGDFLSASRTNLTMHNSVLQSLFDGGLLAAAMLLGAVVFAVWQSSRSTDSLPVLAIVMTLALSAASEVSLAPGLSQTPFFLLVCVLAVVPMKGARGQIERGEHRAFGASHLAESGGRRDLRRTDQLPALPQP